MSEVGLKEFEMAFRAHWFAAMSGGFSVPCTAAAIFFDNKYAQLIFACLAFFAAWFAFYRIWKAEREKVLDLEQKIETSAQDKENKQKIITALAAARDLLFQLHNMQVDSEELHKKWSMAFDAAIGKIEKDLSTVLPRHRIVTLIIKTPSSLPAFKKSGYEGRYAIELLVIRGITDRIGEMIEQLS